jgi:hypothetical protein
MNDEAIARAFSGHRFEETLTICLPTSHGFSSVRRGWKARLPSWTRVQLRAAPLAGTLPTNSSVGSD